MQELLRNAWMGWQDYISDGKLAAVLLLILALYWFGRRKEQHPALYHYTTTMVLLCICPLTAVLLMLYQTKFYDYQWIWSLIPVLPMIAYGGTVFLTEYWADYKEKKIPKGKPIALTILCLMTLLLCSSLGGNVSVLKDTSQMTNTQQLLQVITESRQDTICLWAPQSIMEEARMLDGNIQLVYGRNMWDKSLNGYAYDTYDETIEALYEWMCLAEIDWQVEEGVHRDAVACARIARERGVNCILLPGHLETQTLQLLEQTLGVAAEELEGYYLLRL